MLKQEITRLDSWPVKELIPQTLQTVFTGTNVELNI